MKDRSEKGRPHSNCVDCGIASIIERMKWRLICIFILLGLTGCSKEHWAARYYLYQAEEVAWKADYTMKLVKKEPYEKRFPFYEKACGLYIKAFHLDRTIFNLENIRSAMNVCSRATQYENEEQFIRFEEAYIKTHPVEAQYGLMDVMPMDGG